MKSAATPTDNPALAPLDKPEAKPAAGVFRLDGVGTSAEAGAPPAPRAKLSLQTVMIACLLVGGGGLLYAMRLVGIGPLSSFAGLTKLNDYELAPPGNLTADHRRVLDQLSTATAAPSQVPADQVQKNPFEIAELLGPEPGKPDTGELSAKASADRQRREAETRSRKVQTALGTLKLNGVLGGSRPVARISGEAVRIGDKIADVFTVKAIHGRGVDLEVDGKVYTLTMDEDAKNARKK